MDKDTRKEYKQAIVDELLSRENIKLSNSKGYIGEIVRNDSENGVKPGEERKEPGIYQYGVSEKFCLQYSREDAIAVSACVRLLEQIGDKINNVQFVYSNGREHLPESRSWWHLWKASRRRQ